MNFLQKIGKTIKGWFTGSSSSKSKSYYSGSKAQNANLNKNSAYKAAQKKAAEEKKRKAAEKKKKEEAEKKRKAAEEAKKKKEQEERSRKVQEAYEKIKSNPKANKGALRDAKLQNDAVKRKDERQQLKDKADKVGSYKNYIKKQTGLSGKELQFQQKLGLNQDLKAADVKYSATKHPIATPLIEGATDAASLGIGKLIKDTAKPNKVTRTLDEIEKNYTSGQKAAKTIGEFAGVGLSALATGGLSAATGSKIAAGDNIAGNAIRRIADSGLVRNIAVKRGVNPEVLSARIFNNLTQDLGFNVTTGGVMDLMQAVDSGINKDGSLADKTGAAFVSLAESAALNLAMGSVTEVAAPMLKSGAKNIGRVSKLMDNKRGTMGIVAGNGVDEKALFREVRAEQVQEEIKQLEQRLAVEKDPAVRNRIGEQIDRKYIELDGIERQADEVPYEAGVNNYIDDYNDGEYQVDALDLQGVPEGTLRQQQETPVKTYYDPSVKMTSKLDANKPEDLVELKKRANSGDEEAKQMLGVKNNTPKAKKEPPKKETAKKEVPKKETSKSKKTKATKEADKNVDERLSIDNQFAEAEEKATKKATKKASKQSTPKKDKVKTETKAEEPTYTPKEEPKNLVELRKEYESLQNGREVVEDALEDAEKKGNKELAAEYEKELADLDADLEAMGKKLGIKKPYKQVRKADAGISDLRKNTAEPKKELPEVKAETKAEPPKAKAEPEKVEVKAEAKKEKPIHTKKEIENAKKGKKSETEKIDYNSLSREELVKLANNGDTEASKIVNSNRARYDKTGKNVGDLDEFMENEKKKIAKRNINKESTGYDNYRKKNTRTDNTDKGVNTYKAPNADEMRKEWIKDQPSGQLSASLEKSDERAELALRASNGDKQAIEKIEKYNARHPNHAIEYKKAGKGKKQTVSTKKEPPKAKNNKGSKQTAETVVKENGAEEYAAVSEMPEGIGIEETAKAEAEAPKKSGKDNVITTPEEQAKLEKEYEKNKNKDPHIQRTVVHEYKGVTTEEEKAFIDEGVKDGYFSKDKIDMKRLSDEATEWVRGSSDQNLHTFAKELANGKHKASPENTIKAWHTLNYFRQNPDSKYADYAIKHIDKYLADTGSEFGSNLAAYSFITKLDPETRAKHYTFALADSLAARGKYLKKYLDKKALRAAKGTDKYVDMVEEALAKFAKDHPEIAADLNKLKKADLEESKKLYSDILEKSNKIVPKSLLEADTDLRYAAMLFSPKTDVRNVSSNLLHGIALNISNKIEQVVINNQLKSGAINTEDLLSRRKGSVSKIWVNSHSGREALEKNASKNGNAIIALDWYEKEGKKALSESLNQYDVQGKAKAKVKGERRGYTEWRNYLLTKEDEWSFKPRYREYMESHLNSVDLSGMSKNEKEAALHRLSDDAIMYAKKATYRENLGWAKSLMKVSRLATDARVKFWKRAAGALVNTTLPFIKVGANMANVIKDFLPHNYITGKKQIAELAAKFGDEMAKATTENEKKMLRAAFTDSVNEAAAKASQGMTGTMLFMAGMLAADMLTTSTGEDKYGKFQRDAGKQEFSITIGDKNYSLNWLAPEFSIMFAGAELRKQITGIVDQNGIDPAYIPSMLETVVSRIADPSLEFSVFSGLKDILFDKNKAQYGDSKDEVGPISKILEKITADFVNQHIPTITGQLKRALGEGNTQIAYTDNWFVDTAHQIQAKLPLPSKNVGLKTDHWGNIVNENKGNIAVRLANELLNPATVRDVTLDKTDLKLIELEKEWDKSHPLDTQNRHFLPRITYKDKIAIGGKELKITGKELSDYNQAKATGGEFAAKAAMDSIIFNRYHMVGKNKIYDGLTQKQKDKIIKSFEGKSIKDVVNWLFKQPEFKKADAYEQKKIISSINGINSDQSHSTGAKEAGERAVYVKDRGKSDANYRYHNELTEKQKEFFNGSGLSTKLIMEFYDAAKSEHWSENDEGGQKTVSFTQANSKAFFAKHPELTEKQKELLYNGFTTGKPYGSSSGRGGRGRSGSSKKSLPANMYKLGTKAKKVSMKDVNYSKYLKGNSTKAYDLSGKLETLDKKTKVTPPKPKEVKLI